MSAPKAASTATLMCWAACQLCRIRHSWQFGRERQLEKVSEVIDSLPIRDGNIGANALGMPLEEFVQREARRFSTSDELIDAFLNSRESAG